MRGTLRVLLIDDEMSARKALRELLEEHPIVEIVGEADSAKSAISLFHRHAPDLIFLDVQMPRGDGFSLLPELKPPPAIIFVTAHNRFAVRAFEVNAVDYLMKPVRPDRLDAALRRVFSPQSGQAGPFVQDDRVVLRSDSQIRFLPAPEIACIEAEGNYSRVHIVDKASMFIRRGMQEWEKQLPQPPFLRVHRSLIVNLMAIGEIRSDERDGAKLALKGCEATVQLTRRAYRRLRHAVRDLKKS